MFFLLTRLARVWRKTIKAVSVGRRKIDLKADNSIMAAPNVVKLSQSLLSMYVGFQCHVFTTFASRCQKV